MTVGLAAQGLPATPPTGAVSSPGGITAPLAATPLAGSATGPTRARVDCAGGQLRVEAQDSSLNQVLSAIAACTGMRISGGVPEQRIFGNYGPAAPATVLATLLDGTGTNMLLQESSLDQPRQLILTPRQGGVTPPPPSTYAAAGQNASQAATQPGPPPATGGQAFGVRGQGNRPGPPPSGPGAVNNVNGSPANGPANFSSFPSNSGNNVGGNDAMTPTEQGDASTTPPPTGAVDYPNPPAAGSDTAALLNSNNGNAGSTGSTGSTGTDGSGALTPEAVFQKLKEMQQQVQKTPQ